MSEESDRICAALEKRAMEILEQKIEKHKFHFDTLKERRDAEWFFVAGYIEAAEWKMPQTEPVS